MKARITLSMSPAAAEVILSNCQVQIELAHGELDGQRQLLDIHNTGHCSPVTVNYDHAAWERFQCAYAAVESVKITGNAKVFRQ